MATLYFIKEHKLVLVNYWILFNLLPLIALSFPVIFTLNRSIDLAEKTLSLIYADGNPLFNNLLYFQTIVGTTIKDIVITSNVINILQWTVTMFLISTGGILFTFKERNPSFSILLITLCIPMIISFFFSLLIFPIFMGRNLVIVNFALLFGFAYIIYLLSRENRYIAFVAAIYVVINFFQGYPILHYTDLVHHDWIRAATIINKYNKDNVVIITPPNQYYYTPLAYYSEYLFNKGIDLVEITDIKHDLTNRQIFYIHHIDHTYSNQEVEKNKKILQPYKSKSQLFQVEHLYLEKIR